jgi:DNA-binding MarR family transcriptional regulator
VVDRVKIEDSLGFKLAKASQRMYELFESYLNQADITSKQNGTLLIIHEHPELTQKEIALLQRVDQTTMGQIIDQLEEKQLVMRVKHPTDRRAYCLFLTDTGEKLIASLWADMKRCEAVFLQRLNTDEIAQLFSLLDKIEKE